MHCVRGACVLDGHDIYAYTRSAGKPTLCAGDTFTLGGKSIQNRRSGRGKLSKLEEKAICR